MRFIQYFRGWFVEYGFLFFSDLDIDIVDNGDGTVSIYYKVKDAGEYTVSIKFGGQPVSGGFYTFTVSTGLYLLFKAKKFYRYRCL